jgi:hypothetical protein
MRKDATLLAAVLLGLVSAVSYAQAPIPFINLPLMPDATAPGGPQFTLTVNGTGFVSNSVVNWNGSALATQFVSGSKLTAIVPAADIATASTGWVTVVNPAPGGGTSNTGFFTVTANTGNSVGFGLASSPPTGYNPHSMTVGDFNGDGKLDLAVANACGSDPNCGSESTLSVLLGDGRGNFTLASSPVVGGWPWSVAVGDFNGDGKLDLAVANQSSNTVSVLLGDGTGKFTLASSPATDYGPSSVAVGDFNGDGKLDLAVVNLCGIDPTCSGSFPGTVSILLGDGTGNFTLASSPPTSYAPYSVAVGDFNRDGKLDLAVANSGDGTVSVLLGDGTGNFTLASSAATGAQPESVAVGDFNGDGKLDMAVVNRVSGTVSILLGDGTGSFALASSVGIGLWSDSVAVGDFNGDGKLDLAVSGISILLGDGAGNFALASSAGNLVGPLAVGDFNGDGKLDFAAINDVQWGSTGVSVFLQDVAAVTLSPASLNFGTQLVLTASNPQPVTLANSGNRLLKITKIVASANFSQTNNCPASVPPGGQCDINVSFKPHTRDTHGGTVTITDNAHNSPQTVPLTGVGTAVTLLPSSLDFGDQKVGTTSPPQPVTLTNYGTAVVSIGGIHIMGTNQSEFAQTNNCGTSVPAGGNCTISVTFKPKRPIKSAKTATLEVFDNGGASPQTVALSGWGVLRASKPLRP